MTHHCWFCGEPISLNDNGTFWIHDKSWSRVCPARYATPDPEENQP